jgi:hypothetical protein
MKRLALCLVACVIALSGARAEAQCHLLLLGAGKCSAGASPLLTNLSAYWDLNEASGNAIDVHDDNDLVETSGTIASGAGVVAGTGTSRDFEVGDTEWFDLPDNADVSTGDTDFTIAAWVNLESKGAFRFIVAKDGGVGIREYSFGYNAGSDRFVFNVSPDGTALTTVTANNLGSPAVATAYFIVVWHDASANTITIQVNDGTANAAAHTTGVFDGATAFQVGAQGSSLSMDGLIDEVGFWKRVLTAGERTWLYNSGSGRSYADLVAGVGCC